MPLHTSIVCKDPVLCRAWVRESVGDPGRPSRGTHTIEQDRVLERCSQAR